ncbi:serine/threonine protein kinase [Arthrobacter sp. 35W]|uniref:serine/threonine protein kinase n=1 Tax=Arthrobacter sp. 35W TaxID=1132441 RepID=UPI0003FD3710|nr:protein kinase [Arthrobacter sp. 35W]
MDIEQRPQLAGYAVQRRLGVGASAVTWLVVPAHGGKPLAAKCFPPLQVPPIVETTEPLEPGEWERELRILSRYRHEHLVVVHGSVPLVGPGEGGRALLMDFAAGGSLAHTVAARGPLTAGECVTVLTPLAQVLGYLHGEGVWHGDVSPANVLFTAAGKPLLADFGLGRLLGEGAAAVHGTPGFAAATDVRLSAAADIRAMAAVGWFALTGQAPAPTADRPPLSLLVADVPQELAAALEAGLAEEPGLRPTALEFAQAVFRSAPAEPVDLSLSVHPSVLPELLTRRGPAAEGRGRLSFLRLPWRTFFEGAVRRKPAGRTRGGVAGRTALLPRRWRRVGIVAGMGAAAPWLDPHAPRTGVQLPPDRRAGPLGGIILGHDPGAEQERRTVRPVVRPAVRRAVRPVAAAVVLLAVGAGVLMWRQGLPGAGSEPPSTVAVPKDPLAGVGLPDSIRRQLQARDPEQALAGLSWLRSYALGSGQPALLDLVNAQGSPAMAGDAAVVEALAAAGHTLTGLETKLTEAATVPGEGPNGSGRTVVDATTVTSPFAERGADAQVVFNHVDASTQRLRFVLVLEDARWQISEVLEPVP